MTAPAVPDLALETLRTLAGAGLTAEVVLLVPVETHAEGSRPVTAWEPRRPIAGKLVPATEGGVNVRAGQASPLGDWVLVLEEGAVVSEGWRATVSGEDRVDAPWSRTVTIQKVLVPRMTEVTRRCLVSDVLGA